jgi:carboxyl-terminal processing protease
MRTLLLAAFALALLGPVLPGAEEQPSAASLQFGEQMAEGLEIVHERFIVPMKRGELTRLAILALNEGKQPPPVELGRRLCQPGDLTRQEAQRFLAEAHHRWSRPQMREPEPDVRGVMSKVIRQLDPRGQVIDPENLAKFRGAEGVPVGIGLQMQTGPGNGPLLVKALVKDGPAHKAGLRAGDQVLCIVNRHTRTGKPLPAPDVFETRDKTAEEAEKYLLGSSGVEVEITYQREGMKQPRQVIVKRGSSPPETVFGWQRKADDNWSWWLDEPKKIGYVRIAVMGRTAKQDFDAALDSLCQAGMKALVLDLRFNPGGLLDTSVAIADQFLDDGLICRIRTREKDHDCRKELPVKRLDFPMACLINGTSASGSEIVAGALQDHKRAVLVGERTSGKGSVQNICPFARGELIYTTGLFLRPSGKPWDRLRLPGSGPDDWGIRPDKGFDIELPEKDRAELLEHVERRTYLFPAEMPHEKRLPRFCDRQLERALEHLRAQVK